MKRKNLKIKNPYVSLKIMVFTVEMEDHIATGSTTSFGSENGSGRPYIEDSEEVEATYNLYL